VSSSEFIRQRSADGHSPNSEESITMKKIVLAVSLVALTGFAMAGPSCTVPKDKWLKEADFKKDLVSQGYQIKTFKVSNGCYEIYGTDKAGKRVEIYFDPATGTPVLSK